MREKGLVHIYCGDGKGKTTLAMGLCLRAAGAGRKVLIYQFMKDGSSHERRILEKLPNVSFEGETKSVSFSFRMSEAQKQKERERYLTQAKLVFGHAGSTGADVLLLDEVLYAVSCGLFPEEELIRFLDHRPEQLEVILTGRDPSEAVRARADYISRIVKVKHPFDRGITAREGIEF